jgi:hypothetical protein
MFSGALRHLDKIFVEINAWLFVIAIGLGMLDLTVLVALNMPSARGVCTDCATIAVSGAPPSSIGAPSPLWMN